MIPSILLMIPILSILVGNITDGIPRISMIEEEDFSVSVYETINGTIIQIGGFDNFTEFVEEYLIPRVLVQTDLDPNPFENLTIGSDSLNRMVDECGLLEEPTQDIEASMEQAECMERVLGN